MTPEQAERLVRALERIADADERRAAIAADASEHSHVLARMIGLEGSPAPVVPIRGADSSQQG